MSILRLGFHFPVLIAAALAAVAVPARADVPADFLKDKVVTVLSPSPPGGSFHLYCEVVARNIGKYLPGKPTVIVQNRPGGGGVLAAYMMNVAPADGTALAMVAPGTITDGAVRKLKFDATKFRYLGSVASRAQTLAVWHTSPIKTIDDLKRMELIVGASSRTDATYLVPALINDLLGTKIKIVSGYAGGGGINVAVERGELHGRANYYSGFASVHPEWIAEKKIHFIVGVGPAVPELPQLPNLRDFVKAGTPEAKVLDLIDVNFVVGQAFYVPPRMEDARFAVIRKAFAAMMADATVAAEYEKRKLDFRPISGEQIDSIIGKTFPVEPAVLDRLRTIMGVKS